jgi:pimeloyl-ACP methyl ester carboxylesterase
MSSNTPAHAAAPATPELQTLRLSDGTTLGYRELGSGPPVLLLHGWPTSSYLWRGVMPSLERDNRVLALDLPGFGASDKPLGAGYGFDFFERSIDGFLAAMGVDDVALAGHDLGGPIALRWALGRPPRVRRLALLNTLVYPDFSSAVIEFVSALMTPESRDQLTSASGLAGVMRLGVADGANLPDEVVTAVASPFQSRDARLALAQAGIGLEPDRFEEIARALPSLQVPVRIVYGERDAILPDVAETVARLERDLPDVEATALPEAGHFLQEEAPARVGELLAEFFARD